MTHAHLVAEQGLAGDMLLGALLDAGAPLDAVRACVDALDVGAQLTPRTVQVRGVAATKADVSVPPPDVAALPTLSDVEAALARADLAPRVASAARRTFRALAEAEAAVHATTPEQVRFHELGHLDTIVDVVGVCAALAALDVDALTCGPIAVGGGQAAGDHGTLSVPLPAVTQLLRGFVVHGGSADRELTTPTGAALVATLGGPVDGVPPLRLDATGRGSGDPRRDAPSLLTVLLGHDAAAADLAPAQSAVVLEATVDDVSGELVPVVLDRLREHGAHDAWAVPTLMKKGRPGHTLTALADEADVAALTDVLVAEAGTLGVRWHRVTKHPLPRRWVDVEVEGCAVRVKVGDHAGRAAVVKPEHDDVARAGAELGRPLHDVAAEAVAAARHRLAHGE